MYRDVPPYRLQITTCRGDNENGDMALVVRSPVVVVFVTSKANDHSCSINNGNLQVMRQQRILLARRHAVALFSLWTVTKSY